jgi:hypothetical protein
VTRSKNDNLRLILIPSILAIALPNFVLGFLALGLLSFVVVRPPWCARLNQCASHFGEFAGGLAPIQ